MSSGDAIAAQWPAPVNVHAFVTTRAGGVSTGVYASLNLGDHVGDDPQLVARNRARLRRVLDLPAGPVWLEQRHGNDVVVIDGLDGATTPPVADAAIATTKGVVCAVLTADCLPVLLCDRGGSRVAAIHAGWRGLAAGIIAATVARLAVPGLIAWLGPAIGPCQYEVDAPVRDGVLAATPGAGAAFEASRDGHWHADLYAIARRQLAAAGVRDVYGGDFCTHTDDSRFFSHRRDGPCGRQATLIWLS